MSKWNFSSFSSLSFDPLRVCSCCFQRRINFPYRIWYEPVVSPCAEWKIVSKRMCTNGGYRSDWRTLCNAPQQSLQRMVSCDVFFCNGKRKKCATAFGLIIIERLTLAEGVCARDRSLAANLTHWLTLPLAAAWLPHIAAFHMITALHAIHRSVAKKRRKYAENSWI